MNADQHRAQLVTGQHHAHRHGCQRHALVGCRLGLQQFGVPREGHTGGRQRLLVQWCCYESGDVALQGGTRRPHHAIGRRTACCSADAAPRNRAGQARQLQHRHAAWRHVPCIIGRHDLRHRQLQHAGSHDALRGTTQGRQIPHRKAAAQIIGSIAKGLGHDFGADTRRVTLCDGNGLHNEYLVKSA
jgi:hypothetical protein